MKFVRQKSKNFFQTALKQIKTNSSITVLKDDIIKLKPEQMSYEQLNKECEKLWKAIVKKEYNNTCQWFNCVDKRKITAHHICSAQYANLRYNPANGIVLCGKHHIFDAHKNNLHVYFWLPTAVNKGVLKKLYEKSLERGSKTKHSQLQLIGIYKKLKYQYERLI